MQNTFFLVHWLGLLKESITNWCLKQQKFIVSQFWSLVVQDPGFPGSSAGKESPAMQETPV